MKPRLTDWSLAAATAAGLATGIYSLVAGRAEQAWVFALHAMAGLWLLLLLFGKLRRVVPRLMPGHWERASLLGALALLLALAVLASGVAWSWGVELFWLGFNLLNWHIAAALLLTLLTSLHMFARAKPLRSPDLQGRRPFLRWATLVLMGVLLWPLQQGVQRVLALPGARRRFTGSREAGSFAGNSFPATSWVADAPRALDPQGWEMYLSGAVARPLRVSFDGDLVLQVADGVSSLPTPIAASELVATLDCTGGFYSTQRWRGVGLGALLDAAELLPEARWVRITSITGYRWALPLVQARAALLANQVGNEALDHAHGAPLRLVAPGERGFAWVKWVVAIEVLTAPDWGALTSLYSSSFTPEGRGRRLSR